MRRGTLPVLLTLAYTFAAAQTPLPRQEINAIIVVLKDGTHLTLNKATLDIPNGGLLVWSREGMEILAQYYECVLGDYTKARRARDLWAGVGLQREPSLLTKPTCDPEPWP